MSNPVVDAWRQRFPDHYNDLSDDQLTVAIGMRWPSFLENDEFRSQYNSLAGEERRRPSIDDRARDLAEEGEKLREQPFDKTEEGTILKQLGMGIALQGPPQLGAQMNNALAATAGMLKHQKLQEGEDISSMDLAKRNARLLPFGIFGLMPRSWLAGIQEQFEGAATIAQEAADSVDIVGQATKGDIFGIEGSGNYARHLGAAASSTLPTFALAPAGFGAVVTMAGIQALGATYGEAKDAYIAKGLNSDQAEKEAIADGLASGVITAATTAAFGRTGVESITKLVRLPSFRQSLRTLFSRKGINIARKGAPGTRPVAVEGLLEGGEEAVQEFLDGLRAMHREEPNLTLEELVHRSLRSGSMGAILGVGVAAPVNISANRGYRKFQRELEAEDSAKNAEAVERRIQEEAARTPPPLPSGAEAQAQPPPLPRILDQPVTEERIPSGLMDRTLPEPVVRAGDLEFSNADPLPPDPNIPEPTLSPEQQTEINEHQALARSVVQGFIDADFSVPYGFRPQARTKAPATTPSEVPEEAPTPPPSAEEAPIGVPISPQSEIVEFIDDPQQFGPMEVMDRADPNLFTVKRLRDGRVFQTGKKSVKKLAKEQTSILQERAPKEPVVELPQEPEQQPETVQPPPQPVTYQKLNLPPFEEASERARFKGMKVAAVRQEAARLLKEEEVSGKSKNEVVNLLIDRKRQLQGFLASDSQALTELAQQGVPEDDPRVQQLKLNLRSMGGEFALSDEYVTKISYRNKDTGKLIEGKEGEAGIHAMLATQFPDAFKKVDDWEPGFTTNKGRFVTTKQAEADGVRGLRPDDKPGPNALGIRPEVPEAIMEFLHLNQVFNPHVNVPNVDPASDQLVPDLMDEESSMNLFTKPFGIGRWKGGIGKFLDPRMGVENELDKRLMLWAHEHYGFSRAIASVLGTVLRGVDSAFAMNSGEITNIGNPNGRSLAPSDVIEGLLEDESTYTLNPDQKKALDIIRKIEDEAQRLQAKYGIFFENEENPDIGPYAIEGRAPGNPYFPRIVTRLPTDGEVEKDSTLKKIWRKLGISKPATDRMRSSKGGTAFGAKPGFKFSRLFKTEQEGVEAGVEYEPSIEKRIVTRVQRLYQAIADERLKKSAVIIDKSQPLQTFKAELRKSLADRNLSKDAFEEWVSRELKNKRVNQPGFFNLVFDKATAARIQKQFPSSSPTLAGISDVNDAIKAMSLGLDLGFPFLQGLGLFLTRPHLWGKAYYQSLKALFDNSRGSQRAYAMANLEIIQEMMHMGAAFGSLPEMISGLESGRFVTRLPAIGSIYEAFGRSFGNFLDVAKVELYKSLSAGMINPQEKFEAIQTTEAMLMTGRMESIGVNHRRALLERVFSLAPSYYRGGLNQMALVFQKGVAGKVGAQLIAGYAAAGSLIFYGIAKMLAELDLMDEDEIAKRFDPRRGDFMMWDVNLGDKTVQVGPGGFIKSMVRLGANLFKEADKLARGEKPIREGLSLAPTRNPITRWMWGHAAPVPREMINATLGRDYVGNQVDVATTLAKAPMPIWLRSIVTEDLDGFAAGEFIGFNAWPQSQRRAYLIHRNQEAKEKFGRDYEDLNFNQQLSLSKAANNLPHFNQTNDELPYDVHISRVQAQQRRSSRLENKVDKEVMSFVDSSGMEMAGYNPSFSTRGVKFPLTKDQAVVYEDLIAEEYSRQIRMRMMRNRGLMRAKLEVRQKFLNKIMTDAKSRAKIRLIRHIDSNARTR